MVRYLGSLGQSSDPDGPAYDPDGLPLIDDLIEVITEETTAPGERHAGLAGHEGEIAIRAWAGNPEDPETELSGVGWIRAVEWVPYQLPTFVTPAFAGLRVGPQHLQPRGGRGHDRDDRQPVLPRRRQRRNDPRRRAEVRGRPDRRVVLEWATYYDAADQAGQSRLWSGIHIQADDFNGRLIGSECGIAAWTRAQSYFAGTIGS